MYHDESPYLPESGLEQGPVVLLDGQDGASGEDHELNAAGAAQCTRTQLNDQEKKLFSLDTRMRLVRTWIWVCIRNC